MTTVSLPYQVGAAHAPIDPSPCCRTPFASACSPKSHLCRSAMPCCQRTTRASLCPMLPSQAVGTAWKLAHACHSMRPAPLLSPSASYEPQMQGTENHGRRTPKCKVSWAGRLPPGMYSTDWCHFGAVPVCGSLCEVRSGDARWVLRGPAGQWRLHFEARVRCIDGTLRHAFLLIKVAHGCYEFRQIESDKFKCH